MQRSDSEPLALIFMLFMSLTCDQADRRVIAGSTHQPSLRRVGTSGPPLRAPMTTGVVVGLSTVVVTRTS